MEKEIKTSSSFQLKENQTLPSQNPPTLPPQNLQALHPPNPEKRSQMMIKPPLPLFYRRLKIPSHVLTITNETSSKFEVLG